MNPYQAAMQGEEYNAQNVMQGYQQQLAQQQVQAAQTQNQVGQLQLSELQRQQQNQRIMQQALTQVYAPSASAAPQGQQPAVASPPPGGAPAAEPSASDYFLGFGAPIPNSQMPGAAPATAPTGTSPAPIPAAKPPASATAGVPSGVARMQATIDRAVQLGASPDYIAKMQQGVLETQEAYAKAGTAANSLAVALHSGQQSLLQGMFSQVDDQGNRTWSDATPQKWNSFQQRAVAQNLLQPQDLVDIKAAHPDGSPPTANELQHYSATLEMAKEFAANGLVEAQTREALQNQQKAQLANIQAQRALAAASMNSANNYGEATNRRAALVEKDPDLDGVLPDFSTQDPNGKLTPEDRVSIEAAGQTPEQQATTGITRMNAETNRTFREATASTRDTMAAIAQERADTAAQLVQIRKDLASQPKDAATRQANSQYQSILLQQMKLQADAQKQAADAADPEHKNGYHSLATNAWVDPQKELDATLDNLATLTQRRYALAAQAGIQEPIPLNDALAKINRVPFNPSAAFQGRGNAQPAAVAPPPTAPVQRPTTAPGAPKPQTWNIGGQQRSAGSPIWIGDKQFTFDGLDQNGKVLYH
jgi:hypothetical protein